MIRPIDMIWHKLLIHVTIITYFIALAYAMPPMLIDSNDLDWVGESAGDPLDPSFVGETMSMPLDPELIQKARDAGIIKDYNPSYESGINDMTAQVGQNANVTGAWSLDLISLDEILRHLDLALVQNNDVVMGRGAMIGGNETSKVTASGLKAGNRLSLAIVPVDNLLLFKLDLSLDLHTTGTYTAYSEDGDIWSGDVAGTAPMGVLNAGL